MDGGLIPLVTDLPSQRFVQEIDGVPLVTVKGDYPKLAAEIQAINALSDAARREMRQTIHTTVQERFRDQWIAYWDSTLRSALARTQ